MVAILVCPCYLQVKCLIPAQTRWQRQVADAATLVEIAWLCPGKVATAFRRKGAESVCHMLGGDLSLVDEIQCRHAQVASTAEEEFVLAGNQGNRNQVALPELPYTLQQLQQMRAAAAIVASKKGIQQCPGVLHEFPMAKYTQYIAEGTGDGAEGERL